MVLNLKVIIVPLVSQRPSDFILILQNLQFNLVIDSLIDKIGEALFVDRLGYSKGHPVCLVLLFNMLLIQLLSLVFVSKHIPLHEIVVLGSQRGFFVDI